eukprot:10684665-Ditylum_brightwellii.AAC.1
MIFCVSTVHKTGGMVERARRRPRIMVLNKKHAQDVWGDTGKKEINITRIVDDYNHWGSSQNRCTVTQEVHYGMATLTTEYASVIVGSWILTTSFPPSHKGPRKLHRRVAPEKNCCGTYLYRSVLFNEKNETGISGILQKTVCQTGM